MAERRRALVTGGSRGIGAAAVKALAARGLDVIFTYQHAEAEAETLAKELHAFPGRVEPRQYDLLTGDAESLVNFAVERMGGLDSVILNAGWWSGGRLVDLEPDQWWNIVETNLRSCHRLSRASIPVLTSSPAGSLTLLSSAVGLIGFPGDTAYGSAKAALVGFARSLAKEVGSQGVRVNVLAPGFVSTDMTAGIPDTSRDRILARTLLRRFASPEEMAASIVFLSEDATFTTGTVLSADGGWTL